MIRVRYVMLMYCKRGVEEQVVWLENRYTIVVEEGGMGLYTGIHILWTTLDVVDVHE